MYFHYLGFDKNGLWGYNLNCIGNKCGNGRAARCRGEKDFMYRIAIVEDDRAIAEMIEGYIRRYAAENGIEVSTVIFGDGMEFIEKYRANFDLVFMDIEMPVLDGMSTIKKLRQVDKSVLVVIVTNLAQYAVNGYELGVFDFMVKPVGYYSLAMKLSRAFETLGTISRRQIWVPSRTGKKMISADTLRYVEVMHHMLVFHTTAEEVRGTGTMKKICELLEGLPFALCNQCYLVNLAYVSGINGNTVLVGEDELQISAPKRKNFLCALNNYLGAGGGGL